VLPLLPGWSKKILLMARLARIEQQLAKHNKP